MDRYGAWTHRVASRLLADAHDAEEVTQDVLMTVVQKIGTFKRGAAFSSWLYRIAANAAYERLRSRGSRPEISLEPLLLPSPTCFLPIASYSQGFPPSIIVTKGSWHLSDQEAVARGP